MDNAVRDIFFPCASLGPAGADWIILALRLILGILLLVHGIQKTMSYRSLSSTFPDPIGLGSAVSLRLAIFAELICSLGVIGGFLFRLSLIPVIVTMSVAGFLALKGAPWIRRELPISYLMLALLLMLAGPGSISLDTLVCRWIG